jgi:APA family basic amino acid/polyamine antiporter
MTGPRVYEAMGEAFPRLRFLTGRMPGRGPVPAIVLQTVAALAMMAAPGFEALLTYIGFTLSIFAGLTVAGVLVLRIREPELERPYRVLAYPVTPLLFVAVTAWTIWHSIAGRPSIAAAGFATMAVAALLYFSLQRSVDG